MWYNAHKICKLSVSMITLCGLLRIITASIPTAGIKSNNPAQDNAHPLIAENRSSKFMKVTSRFHGDIHDGNRTRVCDGEEHGIHLASWRWCEYYEHILFCLIVILCGVFKLAFHHTPFLSDYLPESCALIIVGIISGSFIYYGVNSPKYPFPKFTHNLFFNYLLPPIVLDAAYSLYDRDFLYNIGSIITFAVIGTLFNVFAVGFGLYLLEYIGK